MDDIGINRKIRHNFITNYIKDLKLKDGSSFTDFDRNWIKYKTVCCKICGSNVQLVNFVPHQYTKKHVRASHIRSINLASQAFALPLEYEQYQQV